ncbi:MAG: PAS domain S-box protein, partial [Verrucomicrobia bacterium]|nr:PAS domain S-box protein [Verrucomicrobiota bacterium]
HVRRTDGEWRWLQLRSRPRWTADGQLLWDGVATDVTAKREAEDELRRTTRWLFASQRISATGGWALNLRTGAVWASPEARRIYDCDLPSLTQADIGKLPLPEHRPALDRALCELVELGRPYDVEFEITRGRDGRRAQIRSLAEYEAGEGLVIGVVQDITRQKEDERTLRVTQFSMEHSGDGIFWLRPDGSYFRVNEATVRLTGYAQAELLTMAAFDLNPSRSPADWANHWRELCEKKVLTFETHFRTKDGRVFPVEVTSNHIAFEGQEFSCAFVRDTTERKRAEEALRASEEEFRKMFEVASVGMAQADPATGMLVRVNGKMAAITGYASEELCRMRFSELTHPEDWNRDWIEFQRLVKGEIAEYHLEKRYVRKDGSITWVSVNVALVRDPAGRPLRSMAAIEDITERRRADEALRFHKAILEETGRIAKVGGWSFDAVTGEGFWTDEVARIHDLDPALPVNRDAGLSYYVEESRARIEAAVKQAVEAALPYDLELELLSAKGGRKWVRTIGHPTVENGRVVRLHGSFQDITERKLAEQRLREKEQLLHATDRRLAEIVQGMTEACFALDREWRFTFVNDRGEQLLRHTREQMVGHPIWEVFHELVGTPMEASYRRVMAEREPVAFEAFSPVARCWLDIRLFPTAEGVAAFLMDISERKRGEEEREKLARLIEHSRDFIAIADLDGRITFMNAGAQAMIGLPPDRDPKTLRIEDYVPEQWSRRFRESIIPVVMEDGLWQGEMQLRNLTTGAVIDVFRSTFLIRDVAGRPLCLASVTRDITEEKRANEKLADERNLLRTLFDLLPDYIYVKDTECRFIACNDRCAERFGLAATDLLIGQTDRDLFPAEIAAQFEAEDRGVLQGGAVVEREESYPRPGGDLAVVLVTKVPLRDGQGTIVGLVGCNRDITNRKRNEEAIRRLNAELEQRVVERTAELKDANRELEAFSYSVSHDLRAPLRAVDGFSRALQEDFGAQLPQEGLRQIQTIRASAQRMGELIDDLLSFSRLSRQPLTLQPVEMDRLVRSVLADLADESKGRTVELTVGTMPACAGDPRLLRQVWINLISNALKYTRRQATAVIEIGCAQEAGENAYFIRDNGTGFDMQYAGKLFGVFQRLHRAEDFEGSGVGLAIVQRVVHRHGGRVWAEAAVGRGATFHFTLGAEPKS